MNRGLPILDPRSGFLVLTKRSAASGEKNDCNQDHQLPSCGFLVTLASVKFGKTCIIPKCEVILSKFDSVSGCCIKNYAMFFAQKRGLTIFLFFLRRIGAQCEVEKKNLLFGYGNFIFINAKSEKKSCSGPLVLSIS